MGIGLYGTGVVTSTGRYPNIRLQRVTAGMSCGTTWANQIQTAIYMIQKDAYNVRAPGFSTFASYVFNINTVTGSYTLISHAALANVASNQHHRKFHAQDHVGSGEKWVTNAATTPLTTSLIVYGYRFTQGIIVLVGSRNLLISYNMGNTWERENAY